MSQGNFLELTADANDVKTPMHISLSTLRISYKFEYAHSIGNLEIALSGIESILVSLGTEV